MWRITNVSLCSFGPPLDPAVDRGHIQRHDAVATLLPDSGDLIESSSPKDSIFMFCHLGAEIKMQTYPKPCKVLLSGRPFDEETPVDITSRFDDKDFKAAAEKGSGVSHCTLWLQNLPLVGRFVQHGTSECLSDGLLFLYAQVLQRFIGINWRGLGRENASGSTDSYERHKETSTFNVSSS